MTQINNQVELHTPQIELQKARPSLYHLKKNSKCYESEVNILVFYLFSCVLDGIAITKYGQ